jgi:cytochrome c oxidase assembly protein subunit 15/protoheme IX farnesyltransferase
LAIFQTLSSEIRPTGLSNPLSSGRGLLPRADRFRGYAGATLWVTLFVILFGAVVRITGSGAGCGQHWPSCNGEVVHLPRRLETIIELSHRVTSGLALLLVVGLVLFSRRVHAPGSLGRKASYLALVFMLVEALIGAALVLFGLVENDASLGRALVMPAHLVSTYALTAALFVAARSEVDLPAAETAPGRPTLGDGAVLLAAFVLVVVSATGAVTALGDTLYPPSAGTISERLAEDQGVGATFLHRLRVLHPVLAVLGGALVAWLGGRVAARSGLPAARRASRLLTASIAAQLVLGVVNVLLSAPGYLQVAHLAFALLVWLALIGLALVAAGLTTQSD